MDLFYGVDNKQYMNISSYINKVPFYIKIPYMNKKQYTTVR